MYIKTYDGEWTTYVNLNTITGIVVMQKFDGMPGKWFARFKTEGETYYDSTIFESKEEAEKWVSEVLKQSGL